MLKNPPVPMPTKNKVIKTIDGVGYVYHVLRNYEEHGKQKYEIAIIGKENEQGLLVPNETFYKIYQKDAYDPKKAPDGELSSVKPDLLLEETDLQLAPTYQRSKGLVLTHVAKDLGLDKILANAFPEDHLKILKMAFDMLCEETVDTQGSQGLKSWLYSTSLLSENEQESASRDKFFSRIKFSQIKRFFKEWMPWGSQPNYIFYDLRVLQSFLTPVSQDHFLYDKEFEKLPSINLALYYGTSTRLPAYYNIYQGAADNEKDLQFIKEDLESIIFENILFVFDRLFLRDSDLEYFLENGIDFIMPIHASLPLYSQLLESYAAEIKDYENIIRDYDIYGKAYPVKVSGYEMFAHIYYDGEWALCQERELLMRLDSLQEELIQSQDPKIIPSEFLQYFNIGHGTGPQTYTASSDGSTERQALKLDISLASLKVNDSLKRFGFFILLSYDKERSSQNVWHYYNKRKTLEKQLIAFKQVTDINKFGERNRRIVDGKTFVQFISLIIRSHIENKINDCNVSEEVRAMSLCEILAQFALSQGQILISDKSKPSLSITQREILRALGFPGFKTKGKKPKSA
ncbi:MAG: transposase [Deltaproteobacteria bacterium]|jgi:hypothetical protein|nr:transposase [Deltaproteobacteria bacterium]